MNTQPQPRRTPDGHQGMPQAPGLGVTLVDADLRRRAQQSDRLARGQDFDLIADLTNRPSSASSRGPRNRGAALRPSR